VDDGNRLREMGENGAFGMVFTEKDCVKSGRFGRTGGFSALVCIVMDTDDTGRHIHFGLCCC